MIGRRKRPDGLPFRLYAHYGKHKVSFGYKLPNARWAFRLSAPARQKDAVAEIRKQAIERAEALNGDAVEPGTFEALAEAYFDWQEGLPHTDERRKAQITLDENRNELKRLVAVFGRMSPAAIKPKHVYGYLDKRAQMGAPAKANKEVALLSAFSNSAGAAAKLKRIHAAASSTTRRVPANATCGRTKSISLWKSRGRAGASTTSTRVPRT
ncbi:hypothetical protein KDW49_12400 [Burkholderia dolosa]|uniref:hypothetical protein n=1 Tax=Burkholderia dolosa TaxID=152500 RepID=UPI001B9369AC|nr:hypothetical protein [Burkholderia dolosa]MBR8301510.1 hypothetical protein [Burkholderia dolosa]